MATTSSRSGTGATSASQAATDVPTPDHANPGVFVMPWSPLLVGEDPSLREVLARHSMGRVPWDILSALKIHAPDISQDIVICGWPGVEDILERLERVVMRQLRDGLRRQA